MASGIIATGVDRAELREEVRAGAVTPKELLQKLRTSHPIQASLLVVERTRWMGACFLSLIVAIIALFAYVNAVRDMQNNKELIYVRMQGNGTWDIDFADARRSVEFLPATVDSLITQWVTRRYQELPHTVRYDYGYAQLFMTPQLGKMFLDPAQGNAVARAAAIKECLNCPEKHIEVRTIDHTSGERTEFGRVPGQLYRSTVFIREVLKDQKGAIQGEPRLRIVPIHWRLMSKQEIEATVQKDGGVLWLRNNPIGLQILEYQLLDDPSDISNSSGTKRAKD